MKIIIAGDFCPKDRVSEKITRNNTDIVSSALISKITTADYSIVNFECPVVDTKCTPISKQGPNLKCAPKSVDVIKNIGFNCCTLANNHFRDYGDEGCKKTIDILKNSSIDYLGGGNCLQSAQKILVKQFDNKKVALVNFCENEFSIATNSHAGSAPLDLVDNYHQIQNAHEVADYVIVIVHGGYEHFQYPSPRMKKTYRWFVDLGADVIVNHHQHCYSGYEIYNGKPIFYGLGNFCFDWDGKRDKLWTEGFVLELIIHDSISFELIPYIQCKEEAFVREMNDSDAKEFYSRIEELNKIIANDDKLKEIVNHYYAECIPNSEIMMGNMSDKRLIRGLKRKGLLSARVSKEKKNILYDYIFCESHRDKIEFWLNNC